MPILLRTQVDRTDKTPVTARSARAGGLCGFRSTAGARTHRKPENRTLRLRAGALEKVASTEPTPDGKSHFAQNIKKGKIERF